MVGFLDHLEDEDVECADDLLGVVGRLQPGVEHHVQAEMGQIAQHVARGSLSEVALDKQLQ